MELSRTINSDKRYYMDEPNIENSASLLETMRIFNDAKIRLYNAMYDHKYFESGPLEKQTYPAFLKERFGINDYYNAAIRSAASGQLSAQSELKKYDHTTLTAEMDAFPWISTTTTSLWQSWMKTAISWIRS